MIQLYTTPSCPFCIMAKQLLQSKGVHFEDHDLSADPSMRQQLMAKTGQRTVPYIFITDTFIGGYDDLNALDARGELAAKIAPYQQN